MIERVNKKETTIKGRKFILEKYDPMFGFWLVSNVLGKVIATKGNKLEACIKALTDKPLEESIQLQKSVLKYCYEVLQAGPVKVIDEAGNFAIENPDGPIVMSLFVQSIMFSLSDFFDQEVMSQLMKEINKTFANQAKDLPQKN